MSRKKLTIQGTESNYRGVRTSSLTAIHRLNARPTSLRTPLNHRTTLVIAAHSSHWSNVSCTVPPKATLRKPEWTTAACSNTDTAIAPQSQRLTNKCANALAVSERALMQLLVESLRRRPRGSVAQQQICGLQKIYSPRTRQAISKRPKPMIQDHVAIGAPTLINPKFAASATT